MALPDYESLMLPILDVAARGETTLSQCREALVRELAISAADAAELLPSGSSKLRNRVGWAKTYLVQAGLAQITRRGAFKATERGRSVLAEKPAAIDIAYLRRFPEFVRFLSRRRGSTGDETLSPGSAVVGAGSRTPEEVADAAAEAIRHRVRSELLERVLASSPAFFERVIVDLLLRMGYGGSWEDAGRTLGGTGDGGVDGVIKEDRLGLDLVYIQAKRYRLDRPVSEEMIRGFSGSLLGHGASKGVFVTTSSFTDQARRFATALRQQRVVLIDGDTLANLMIDHNVGVRSDRRIEIPKLETDYFDEESGEPPS